MLLQTNSYVVPKEKRAEHARLLSRFRQTLLRLGADHFEVYEQTGANWSGAEGTGRFVQIMRFRDRKQQIAVQTAERNDPQAQQLIREFCELINFPYQQQQGLFAVGFYTSIVSAAGGGGGGGGALALSDGGADQGEGPPVPEDSVAAATASQPPPSPPPPPAAPVPGEPVEAISDEHSVLNGALDEAAYDAEGEEPLAANEQEDVRVPDTGETATQSGGDELPDDKGPH
jgi:hypothetical protein